MKHFVLGYPDVTRKGAVTVLYAGDSRKDAQTAMKNGGEGIAVADYVCNPQVSQSKRFRSKGAAVVTEPPVETPVSETPVETPVVPEAELSNPPEETTPDLPTLPLPKKARNRSNEE